ncbi:response regulator [Yinghuangia seranimata]|uniref:response regulator n=1 Tax=Yinghuangia seranimata TaxID=408067 RepID=UPI00248AF1FD|nr:response regulator transcription factor [Yinghuangia seranimata]MDI2130378.1 response regulator transcription factor [Yinghuangia seranimata]
MTGPDAAYDGASDGMSGGVSGSAPDVGHDGAPAPAAPPLAPVRVVLADDQPLVRSGLRMLITAAPDLVVVGEAANGAEAVALAARLRPDVVVMDIRMPGVDGIEATRRITAESTARVVVLTTFDDDENVYAALRAGSSGFLVKDMALDDILAAIRVVAAGDALIAPGVTRRLIADFTAPHAPVSPAAAPVRRTLDGVTDREREVLALVARGLSNSEIAAHLIISTATAKTHVARLFTKLDARDRVHLVILAYEAGLGPAS